MFFSKKKSEPATHNKSATLTDDDFKWDLKMMMVDDRQLCIIARTITRRMESLSVELLNCINAQDSAGNTKAAHICQEISDLVEIASKINRLHRKVETPNYGTKDYALKA